MDNSSIGEWLDELARHFERHDTQGEDRVHWANVCNAENARKIKAALAATEKENARLREASGLTARETLLLIEQAMEFEVPPVVAKLLRKARLNLLTVLVRFTEPMQEKGTKE